MTGLKRKQEQSNALHWQLYACVCMRCGLFHFEMDVVDLETCFNWSFSGENITVIVMEMPQRKFDAFNSHLNDS